jgi:hypothetical protein
MSICRRPQILRFLLTAVMRAPKLTIAVALIALAALASILTYSGYLAIGVLADHLGTGRGMAGLLVAVVFARVPWVSRGGVRVVGLLPKPARRPVMVGLFALCCLHFLWRSEYVQAACTGLATAFLLTYPWLSRAVFGRLVSPVFSFAGRNPPQRTDDNVIDGEFREKKD